ncbi:MAG: LD-carboxypeptidase [Saprospiraceae bacterium]|nr:LD-carboxypeptidase [Saprospiraceae bacterium]
MNRRSFTQKTFAFSALSLAGIASTATLRPNKKKIRPARLKKGDTIGLITPGSFIPDDALEKAIKNIESLGFQAKMGKHIRAERGFTAGTDQQRLEDLHRMFSDPQVQAVWCARGGYGCGRLLPMIDYQLIKKHPKVLIGYSDITALLQAIYIKTGLIGFHGPVGASELTDYTRSQFQAVLMNPSTTYSIPIASENQANENATFQTQILCPGTASGPLAGGNLSLLASMAGTSFALDATDKIVFLEDIGEKPYRIDRMLTQLRQSANLHKAKAIALGIFADCEADPDARSLSLMDTLKDRLYDLKIPVIYGLSFGHIDHMCTLPIGVPARLDTTSKTLTLEEAAVV